MSWFFTGQRSAGRFPGTLASCSCSGLDLESRFSARLPSVGSRPCLWSTSFWILRSICASKSSLHRDSEAKAPSLALLPSVKLAAELAFESKRCPLQAGQLLLCTWKWTSALPPGFAEWSFDGSPPCVCLWTAKIASVLISSRGALANPKLSSSCSAQNQMLFSFSRGFLVGPRWKLWSAVLFPASFNSVVQIYGILLAYLFATCMPLRPLDSHLLFGPFRSPLIFLGRSYLEIVWPVGSTLDSQSCKTFHLFQSKDQSSALEAFGILSWCFILSQERFPEFWLPLTQALLRQAFQFWSSCGAWSSLVLTYFQNC